MRVPLVAPIPLPSVKAVVHFKASSQFFHDINIKAFLVRSCFR